MFDAGLFIGALLRGDPRHAEAYPLVEAARRGELPVCTTAGILSEVYTVITVDPEQFGATQEEIRLALEVANIESRPVWKKR